MENLNPNMFVTGYISLSTVTVWEFYKQWCDLLGVEKKGGKPGMFQNMKEQMIGVLVSFAASISESFPVTVSIASIT